jgi:hypothetical protein
MRAENWRVSEMSDPNCFICGNMLDDDTREKWKASMKEKFAELQAFGCTVDDQIVCSIYVGGMLDGKLLGDDARSMWKFCEKHRILIKSNVLAATQMLVESGRILDFAPTLEQIARNKGNIQ